MDLPPVQQRTQQCSWFLDALGEVGDFAGRLFKYFVLIFSIGISFIFILGIVVYYASNHGHMWRALIGALVTIVGGVLTTFLVSMQASVVMALSETIRAKQLAKRVLDVLFSTLMGITTEKPQGDLKLTCKLHGLPVAELELRLKQAGRTMLEEKLPASGIRGMARWLVNKAVRLVVWVTIRVIIAYSTAGKKPDENVDLLALRSSLTTVVDDLVVNQLKEGARRFALLVALAATAVCWLLITGLNRLPFGN